MNKITTILLILCVIGLFTTAFMLNEIRIEMHNKEPVIVNNTTNGTVDLTNETLTNDTEETTTEPIEEEEVTDETTSHEMYKSQFNQKDGEPKGETLNEEYIEQSGASNGKELQEYMESHVPDDYK